MKKGQSTLEYIIMLLIVTIVLVLGIPRLTKNDDIRNAIGLKEQPEYSFWVEIGSGSRYREFKLEDGTRCVAYTYWSDGAGLSCDWRKNESN